MGYNTRFALEIAEEDREKVLAAARELGPDWAYGGQEFVAGLLDDNTDDCKWYDHEADMLMLSAKLPGVLLKLTGEGEEAGDVWEAFFRDGKSYTQAVEIKFPPFDEGLLR
jgi:hypothetical protein